MPISKVYSGMKLISRKEMLGENKNFIMTSKDLEVKLFWILNNVKT
jgi:hypothetical protein